MTKRALITGATSGIGAEFARQLANEGSDVVLVARDQARLETTADELKRLGVQTETISADLSTDEGVKLIETRLGDETSPIDFLVNNAGFGLKGSFTEVPIDKQVQMIDVNVTALVRLTYAAATAMTKRKRGDILNLSSVAGFTPSLRPSSTYAATKSFVATFSEGLAPTLAVEGVTISAVCPGWVRTDFHNRAGINMSKLPKFLWLEPDFTVKTALHDHRSGRALSFPGWPYKVFMGLIRILPRNLQHTIARFVSRKQH